VIARSQPRLAISLGMLRALGRNNLHDYRLETKEFRDMLKMAKEKHEKLIKTLGECKDKA
jgi:hypothetical protein